MKGSKDSECILWHPPLLSLEIAKLVESRHDNVMVSINRLANSGVIRLPAMQVSEEINNLGFPVKRKHYVFSGEPWFVAKDIAAALGYGQTANGLKHCKHPSNLDELNKINGLAPATKWIPESDVYRLLRRAVADAWASVRRTIETLAGQGVIRLPPMADFEKINDLESFMVGMNDLHKAAGGLAKDKPGNWLQSQQTVELVAELNTAGNPAVSRIEGRNGGTYVAKDVALALGYENTTQAIRLHCKRVKSLNNIMALGSSSLHPHTKLILTNDATATMTSLEIAKLVESRHDNVKRTINRLAKSGIIRIPPTEVSEEINNLGFTVQREHFVFSGEQSQTHGQA